MPGEKNLEDLPKGVKDVLPEHAQEIYREAHNNALEQYKDPKKRREKLPSRKWRTRWPGPR